VRGGDFGQSLRDELLDIQRGKRADRHGWMHKIA